MRALDVRGNGVPDGGGAARIWSLEGLRRLSRAAALGGARRGSDTEGDGEGGVAPEDSGITRSMNRWSARVGEVGGDRNRP